MSDTATTSTLAPALAGVAMLLSAAVESTWLHGDRHEAAMAAAVNSLKSLPRGLGAWRAIDMPLDESQRQAAGVRGGLVRVYTHDETRDEFTVTLLVGPPGSLAVHPPTACFRGQGYTQRGEVAAIETNAANRTHRFHTARFRSPPPYNTETDVAWAWSDSTTWSTPTNPRLHFASAPALKKLYVAWQTTEGETMPSAGDTFQSSAARDFFRRLIEAIQGNEPATQEAADLAQ